MKREGEWSVHTNRHPNTDGSPWGWVDEAIRLPDNPFCLWGSKEIAVWSGEAARDAWQTKARSHNEALVNPERAQGGGHAR